MSTTESSCTFCVTNAPGSTKRLATKPFTGELTVVLARLIRSSSRRDDACCNCACARSSCAWRRLVAGLGVVERLAGKQAALEQALVAIEVGPGERQVGLALADRRARDLVRRIGLAQLLEQFLVLDLGEHLAAAHRVADAHADRLQPTLRARHDVDGLRADEAADHFDVGLQRGAR